MPRHVQDAQIETRDARRRLPVQSEPHWRAIVQGAHLGYYKGARRGAWVVRWRKLAGGYQKATLGEADDVRDADDERVLDYRQAHAKALQTVAAWERGGEPEAAPATPYTVADAIRDYQGWAAKHRRPSTVRDIRTAYRAHIEAELGRVELAKLTTARLRRWHEGLAEKPRRLRSRPGAAQQFRPVADDAESLRRRRDTANRIRTILIAGLNHAFEAGKVASDATWRKVKPFRETGAARIRYLSLDECRRLLNSCPTDFRALVRGALATGCRYGELCRASVADFNVDVGALLVQQSKSGRPRHIPLDDQSAAFLASLAAGRPGEAPLFARADGGCWGPSHQARPLLAACEAARVEPCGFHALRHSYASHRIMAGMPLMAVASVLGHADTRMCERHYGHLSAGYIRDAVRSTALDLGPLDATVTPLRQGGRDGRGRHLAGHRPHRHPRTAPARCAGVSARNSGAPGTAY